MPICCIVIMSEKLGVVGFEEGFHVVVEGAVEDAFANFFADAHNEAFVVDAGESFAGDFVDFIEVMEICCVVIFTTIAIAVWFDG